MPVPRAHPVRLANLFDWARGDAIVRARGRVLTHEELVTRFTHQRERTRRLAAMSSLHERSVMAIVDVGTRLARTVDELEAVSLQKRKDEREHVRLMTLIKHKHVPDTASIATAFKRLCQDASERESQEIDTSLDEYFRSNIGINTLLDHSLAIHEHREGGPKCGVVSDEVDVRSLVLDVCELGRELCERNFPQLPDAPDHDVSVHCKRESLEVTGQKDADHPRYPTVVGVPHLIHAAMLEVVKNAMRATAEFSIAHKVEMAPLRVAIAESDDEVSVLFEDRGGGIPRHKAERLLFGYCRSSVESQLDEIEDSYGRPGHGSSFNPSDSPIAGFGVGFPYARAQIRYFGGDLKVLSVPGLGTSVCFHLPRDPDQAVEEIPTEAPWRDDLAQGRGR